MKKLFLMTTVVCLGLAAQAETSWHWTMTGISHPVETSKMYSSGATAHLFGYDEFNCGDSQEIATASVVNGAIDKEFSTDLIEAGVDYCFYFEIRDTIGQCEYYYVSNEAYATGSAESTTEIEFSFGNWDPPPPEQTPEPTSGLLLLVGLAGLALKRNKA